MKNRIVVPALVAAACLLVMTAAAGPPPHRSNVITLDGRLNTPTMPATGGTAYLTISFATPRGESPRRRPMNISVVLDRSGSMADGRKMEYAKSALNSLIDRLDDRDILSVVIYDDVVEILREAQPLGDTRELKRRIAGVTPRGMTNLGGGMIEGFRQVNLNVGKEYTNRVILLSDGLANQGITDQGKLGSIARKHRTSSISLTTMGVGLDYNENLMMSLAESGGGNYYFIEHPNTLASILGKEFNTLSRLMAQNAVLELSLGRNVELRDVIGCEFRSESRHHIIPVGDLYFNERREFTLELKIPEGSGTLAVATGRLRFEVRGKGTVVSPSFTSSIRYTRELAEVERHRDLDAQSKADVAVATRRVEEAMKVLDEGKPEEAAELLGRAAGELSLSPAASGAGASAKSLRDQMERMKQYQEMVSDSSADARRTKKAIQFDNYQIRKHQNQ